MTLALVPGTSMASLTEITVLDRAEHIAAKLSGTEFVPVGLRNRPEAVLACILKGVELGIGPMLSLASIAVINGRPSISAELMRALINQRGHSIYPLEEPNSTRCTMIGRRTDNGIEDRVTWTMDDAKRAGLSGKDTWQKYPREMLTARATATLARRQFPDVIGGLLATEEAQDMPVADIIDSNGRAPAADTPAATPPTRQRLRRGREVAAGETATVTGDGSGTPAAPIETAQQPQTAPADDVEGEPTGTHAQQIAIRARELGLDRAEVIAAVTGGQLRSARALTDAQGSAVLVALDKLKTGEQQLVVNDQGAYLVDGKVIDAAAVDTAAAAAPDIEDRAAATRDELIEELKTHMKRITAEQRLEIGQFLGWDGHETMGELLSRQSDDNLQGALATASKL